MSDTPSPELPPAAKAAAEKAVQAAVAESQDKVDGEDGEVDSAAVTIFNDAEHFNVVHPLLNTWSLWFDNASKQDKAKSWDDQLTEVMTFNSVEEFWGLYNNIVPPSHIAINSNYYLFKKGIKPAWEDAANAKGGKWAVQLPRDKSRDNIDKWWLYTMLAAIGETFETPYNAQGTLPAGELPQQDQLTGVIVSSRKTFYRINIWTRTSDTREKVEDIGKHFKYGVLGHPVGSKAGAGMEKLASDVEFVSHEASQSRSKSKGWTV